MTHHGMGAWPAFLDETDETPACRAYPTELFFPPSTNAGGKAEQTARAKAVCADCPLLDPCRSWALQQPATVLYGIWGGTTTNERRQLVTRPRGTQPAQFRKTTTSTTTRSA